MTLSRHMDSAIDHRREPQVEAARPTHWSAHYVRRLAATDLVAIVVGVCAAQLLRFGVGASATIASFSVISYTAVSVSLAFAWLVALSLFRARDPRMVGEGAEEYRRLAHASFALFGAVAIVGFLAKIEIARGYLAVALPVGLTLLLVGRMAWRRWLQQQRREGRYCSNVIVVGARHAAQEMASIFAREQGAGFRVVGVCEPGWAGSRSALDVDGLLIPVLGDETAVMAAVAATRASVVAVSNTESLGAAGMRSLAWQLEASEIALVVAPGVVDVAGPRLQVRPVAGMPLLHVDKPQYEGANKFRKQSIDLAGATFGLLVLSPLMVGLALAVKLSSRGPVFYRSERIGLNGRPFPMLKFRSMDADADLQRIALADRNEGAWPLFKIRQDPRVTPLGRWMRRFSLDELPQLFNVLVGHMSIVGPRPQLPTEVLTYTDMIQRRLLVKPGLTGLWQVSGRSNLSWEESVRLDLYYVENWSLLQDMMIVWRTVRAVLRSDGAY